MSKLLIFFWVNCSFALLFIKISNSLKFFLLKSYFMVHFLYILRKNEQFAHSLFYNPRCEGMAQVAQQKWVMWAYHSGHSQKMSDNERFTQVTHQKWANRSFFWVNHSFDHYSIICWQKTSNSLRKPKREFPTLVCIIRRSQALRCASYWLHAVLACAESDSSQC